MARENKHEEEVFEGTTQEELPKDDEDYVGGDNEARAKDNATRGDEEREVVDADTEAESEDDGEQAQDEEAGNVDKQEESSATDGDGEDQAGGEEQPKDGNSKKREKRDASQAGPNKKQKVQSGETKSTSNGSRFHKFDTSRPNAAAANGKVGTKHDEPKEHPAPQASADRLPEKGQWVQWKALPGYVEGEVVEVLKKEKEIDGKSVKASGGNPRIVLKSAKSGKICVHKPEAVYFE